MIDLTGKRAVVTGGSRGIGGATSRLLAQCGAHVALSYRSRVAEAEAMVASLTALGVKSLAQAAELSDRASVDAFFSRVERGTAMIRPFRRGFFNRIELIVAAPIAPDEVCMKKLKEQIAEMRGDFK